MNRFIVKSGAVLLITSVVFTVMIARSKTAMGQFFFMQKEDIGKEVKDFTLKVVNGEEANLAKYRDGKKTVVFFWATWCPHCVKELQVLNTQKEEFNRKDIKLVLVDVGESEEIVDRYLRKKNIEMNVFLDEDSAISDAYGLIGVPTFYFVDENGIVLDVEHSLPKDLEAIFKKT